MLAGAGTTVPSRVVIPAVMAWAAVVREAVSVTGITPAIRAPPAPAGITAPMAESLVPVAAPVGVSVRMLSCPAWL